MEKRAVIYARYSCDKQSEQSIEGQIHVINDFAVRNGYTIVSSYIDRAKSAKTANRPQFLQMISDSAKGIFDFVLVYKLDRFSRNRYDSAFYKHKLKQNGVQVISATECLSDNPESIITEAMLEAMAEGATTIGGQRIALPKPFMVIATQNPIEEEGTFNLPEAQMDRFMMKAVLTYPTAQEEQRMLAMLTRRGSDTVDQHALTGDTVSISDVEFLRSAARRVHVSDAIMQYAVNIAATSRGAGTKPVQGLSSLVRLGASPRASIALVRIGQANALLQGRDYVIPEDVKAFAHEVLRHRILMTFEALADGVTSDQVVDSIVQAVPVP